MRYFVIFILAILLSTSCKKSDVNPELSLAEITTKVKNLKSMKDALNTFSEVRDMNQKRERINNKLTEDLQVNDFLRKINNSKSKQEIISVLNLAGIQESEILVNKLDLINGHIMAVYLAVPELKKLTAQERTQMFTEILKEHDLINKLKLQSNFLGKLNLSNKIAFDDFTCYHNFSYGYTGCDNRFIRDMTTIWGTFLMGMEHSAGFGVQPLLGVALIATAAVYVEREVCMADVFTSFNICAQALM
jgi:hypothetical protein